MRRLRRYAGQAMQGGAVLLGLSSVAAGERVIFVNLAAIGQNTGNSWADAYADVQDALDDARDNGGCPCEVWVAAGVYKPDRGTGDRTMAFEVTADLSLYGGFAGWETVREQRDPAKNEAVLEGDLLGDDDASALNATDCCVETGLPGCEDAECVQRVSADRPQCVQEWNSICAGRAVRLCCQQCRRTRCDNSFNLVRGAGLDFTAVLDGLTLAGGEATPEEYPFYLAGGVSTLFEGPLTIRRCTFRRNFGWWATSIYADAVDLTDSAFVGSEFAEFSYATNVTGWGGYPSNVSRCIFTQCSGGALAIHGGVPATVRDCSFVHNSTYLASSAAGISGDAPLTVSNCLFLENYGGAIGLGHSATISESVFIDNSAHYGGAGIDSVAGGMKVVNCLFVGNTAGVGGPNPGLGGAVQGGLSGTELVNSTFVANHAGNVGGAWLGDRAKVTNCIFWGNTSDDPYETLEQQQVDWSHYYLGSFEIDHSIVEGWTGEYGGVGNSGDDPLFVDPLGLDGVPGTEDDDLRLSGGSPAINAGAITASMPDTELDGHPRVLCGAVDIGAYEFGTADVYCDGVVGPLEVETFVACLTGPDLEYSPGTCLSFDANPDGAIDLSDFAFLQGAFTGE